MPDTDVQLDGFRVAELDPDRVKAATALVIIAGGRDPDVAYLVDGVPIRQADWWAACDYDDERVLVEHQSGPAEAMENLARRLLRLSRCRSCGRQVSIDKGGPVCVWVRDGTTYVRGCAKTHPNPKPTDELPPRPAPRRYRRRQARARA